VLTEAVNGQRLARSAEVVVEKFEDSFDTLVHCGSADHGDAAFWLHLASGSYYLMAAA